MTILIIGSKGFIGSYSVLHFSKLHEVWECDVVAEYANPRYILVDATNADYSEVFQKTNFDVCINCSGAASVPDSILNPRRDFLLNVTNVYAMLDSIKKHNPGCKFINLSSAAVYGNPVSLPITENHILMPLSPYGFHKKIAEAVLHQFAIFYHIRTCSLRIFSAYGNGLKKQLFWDLYSKTQQETEIQLSGTGNESRDFIHISDLVNQIDLVIGNAQFEGEAINAANGKAIRIKEIAEKFVHYSGYTGRIVFTGGLRQGDPINWQADIYHFKRWGYKQKISIDEGIERYSTWSKGIV
jgi:dTDP-glucose 4,6-dehydratase/UDP-glucose 4-epimerase